MSTSLDASLTQHAQLAHKTVVLLTDKSLPELTPSDQIAIGALREAGATVTPVIWNTLLQADPTLASLKSADAVIIRTCWDYQFHQAAFQALLQACSEHQIRLWNAVSLVQWNLDKRYLRDLAAAGIPTVPTVWLEASQLTTQAELPALIRRCVAENGWEQAVIKPIISASGTFTTRLKPDTTDETLADLWPQALQSGLMVQPFLSQVCDEGEWTMVYFSGAPGVSEFSHAVLKTPEAGEFRVQTHFGGQNHAIAQLDPALRAQADRVMAGLEQCQPTATWLFARVDGVVVDGQLLLMELEVIEPHLFFECDEVSAGRYVQAVARALG